MKLTIQWACAAVFAFFASFACAQNVPLGPGDMIKIQVFGNPDLSLETRVNESGKISYPLLGEVRISGMDMPTAEKQIATLLQSGGFVRNPQVTITVTQLQSRQVSVLGDVNRPGRYPLDVKRTLVDMLALAGGVSAEAGDSVQLIRTSGGKTTKLTVDLLDIIRSANMDKNIEMAGGDVVYVERAKKFYIYGEVQRPGVYRLERNMTVIQALSTGGGLTPRGTERGVKIKRRDADGKLQVIDAKHDDLVQVDDVVYVKESLF